MCVQCWLRAPRVRQQRHAAHGATHIDQHVLRGVRGERVQRHKVSARVARGERARVAIAHSGSEIAVPYGA